MQTSPTSSLGSSRTSSTSASTLQPEHTRSPAHRRRSVDNGGLSLALNDHSGSGSGKGWGGWETDPTHTLSESTNYAELVLAMREQTATTVDHAYLAARTSYASSSELGAQRENLIRKLASWNFDASQLSPDEVLGCACLLFESLWLVEGMETSIGLQFDQIRHFLASISKIYRAQSSYHNFQHAVDVLQAVYCYLHQAGCVPGVEILLEQDAETSRYQPSEGQAEAKAAPCENASRLPSPRTLWRRLPPDTLLRRALRNQDIFALYVAAVGHDIAHPGLSNTFLSNAKAPLAELFDDVSVLEKFHCTVLLQVMRAHRMVQLLDRTPSYPYESHFSSKQSRPRTESDPGSVNRGIDPTFFPEGDPKRDPIPYGTPPRHSLPRRPGKPQSASIYPGAPDPAVASGTGTEFRALLVKSILATDMSVHFKWMPKMEELLQKIERGEIREGCDEEAVDPDTRLLLCQALIKCADISNPCRPPPICTHWTSSLLSEWAEQAMLEKQLALPISVTASDNPIDAANGQVVFIGTFTKPLLQVICGIIPEMAVFKKQCDANLSMWKARIRDLQSHNINGGPQDSTASKAAEYPLADRPLVLPTSPPDVSTMFALSLPTRLYTPSSERPQTSWPDATNSLLLTSMQSDNTDSGHDDERVARPTPPDSRSSSPRSNTAHHRHHSSHTQLPHVSIPATSSASFSPPTSQHAKSSSTVSASASSPLFSPRSIPTSSSSPRSDTCSGSAPSAIGLQFRPGLRAAYEANERPKAMKRMENRTSWQGSVAGHIAAIMSLETSTDPPSPMPPHVSNGS